MQSLLSEIRHCRLCETDLPFGANPVLQCATSAKILIAGQAPGKRVHVSGMPFDDPSGERLRDWLGLTRAEFYDASAIAILPMGFCDPGSGKSGDLPPRTECAARWREPLLAQMKKIELMLILGQYAQRYHLQSKSRSLTETVLSWRDYWPAMIPLPHPSPRNNRWLKQNPWFETEVLPELKIRINRILYG